MLFQKFYHKAGTFSNGTLTRTSPKDRSGEEPGLVRSQQRPAARRNRRAMSGGMFSR